MSIRKQAMDSSYERVPIDSEDDREHVVYTKPQRSIKTLVIGITCLVLALGFFWHESDYQVALVRPSHSSWQDPCSPLAFDQGVWEDSSVIRLGTLQDVHWASGYEHGCKAGFQQTYNFGTTPRGPFDALESVMSYAWAPHPSCSIAVPSIKAKLQALVDSPLLLVGDGQSRQHLFSLSCELAEHVIWKGAASPTDDAAPPHEWLYEDQHLLLDPQSSLRSSLRLPRHFDINKPIVTFMLAETPLSRREMLQLSGPGIRTELISPTAQSFVAELDSERTINAFTAANSHYKTMLLSTGASLHNMLSSSANSHDVSIFMRASLKAYYASLLPKLQPKQKIYVRAALQPHSNCAKELEPIYEVDDEGPEASYAYMDELNRILESETIVTEDPRLQWIGLNRFARLRPDAHLPDDCRLFSVASGIYQNVNKYLWHVFLNP